MPAPSNLGAKGIYGLCGVCDSIFSPLRIGLTLIKHSDGVIRFRCPACGWIAIDNETLEMQGNDAKSISVP